MVRSIHNSSIWIVQTSPSADIVNLNLLTTNCRHSFDMGINKICHMYVISNACAVFSFIICPFHLVQNTIISLMSLD